MKTLDGAFKDTHNYLVTTTDLMSDWSDPLYLNSSGFDPSLFHDNDGKKWLLNMIWDYRSNKNKFAGIVLQEFSILENRLIGNPQNIFKGTELGSTEGPHLYKYNGFYYLMTAEGGTWTEHAVTMARSKEITGPYEVDPDNPILTSSKNTSLPLQRSGHGSLVRTQNDEWYLAHLCSRPVNSKGRSILGRETSLQKMKWTDDLWLRLEHGGNQPELRVIAPELPEHKWEKEPSRDDFNSDILNAHFATLRIPLDEDILSLKERPGNLRLKGAESLGSRHRQSLVARRQQAFK